MVATMTINFLAADIVTIHAAASIRLSKDAVLAARRLVHQVRLHRLRKAWTESEAAERVGLSPPRRVGASKAQVFDDNF